MFLQRKQHGSLSIGLLLAVLLCASCDQLAGLLGDADGGQPVPSELFPLHKALEDGGGKGHAASVAVLAVVNDSRIAAAGTDPAAGPEQAPDGEALRLERLLRQELNNGFVRNRKLEVLQPGADIIAQAQAEVQRVNSAALSSEQARQLGERLHVDFIVCAVIEEGGRLVNVASQRSSDGKLVFQDSVRNWSIFAEPDAAQ